MTIFSVDNQPQQNIEKSQTLNSRNRISDPDIADKMKTLISRVSAIADSTEARG